tara:strand:- start:5634 stop:6224 length:591 start_codon:yes stop_codon:yes gene_type:complete
MTYKLIIGIVVLVVGLLGWTTYATGRGKYETAAFELKEKEGKFEIRAYRGLALVSTPMAETGKNSMNDGFGKLFRYISGKNAQNQEIAMTTPVFVGPAGSEERVMSFVVPAEIASQGSPKPSDQRVFLSEMDSGTYVVFRFSGWRSSKSEAKALQKLQTWVATKELKVTGSPIFAYYDPPWTPGPMRRNEVLLPVK